MKKQLLLFAVMLLIPIAMFANPYLVSVSADPFNGGSAYIGDDSNVQSCSFDAGQQCTVHAEHSDGFAFVNWTTDDGIVLSQDEEFTFQVSDNIDLVAHFVENIQYNIIVLPNPLQGGMVEGDSTYNAGVTCTVIATANEGYEFVNWTEENDTVFDQASYSFIVDRDRTLVANFVEVFQINVEIVPVDGGTIYNDGPYTSGSTCVLHAVANPGFSFVKWTKDGTQVSTNPNYSFTVTGNATYVAHFQQNITYYTITATASPTSGGTVSGGGSYASGSTCTLHAVANSGYTFLKWMKNGTQVSTNPNYSFTVTDDANIVAHFQQIVCSITVSSIPSNGGSVYIGDNHNSTSATFEYNQTCVIHAVPHDDWLFEKWMKGDEEASPVADFSFNVTDSANYIAYFKRKPFDIQTRVEPENSGTISVDTLYYVSDTKAVVELTANANEDYVFSHWTNDGVDSSTNRFLVEKDTVFIANFLKPGISCDFSAVNPCNREKCTYTLTGTDFGYDEYDYTWTTSDEQSVIIVSGNSANIRWGTDGPQTVKVKVFKKSSFSVTYWFEKELSVNVTSRINADEVQDDIVVKLTDGKPYLLIFPNNTGNAYKYQWFKDNEPIIGANQQYLYQEGGLEYGIYKVYISKDEDENGSLICGAFSNEYQVMEEAALSFSVYPNPSCTGDNLVVVNNGEGEALLSIFTVEGKLLHCQTVTGGFADVTVNLPQGIYVLRIANGQNVKVEKLVIQ